MRSLELSNGPRYTQVVISLFSYLLKVVRASEIDLHFSVPARDFSPRGTRKKGYGEKGYAKVFAPKARHFFETIFATFNSSNAISATLHFGIYYPFLTTYPFFARARDFPPGDPGR